MTEAVIITTGRTGSTYLCDVLNSHPDINCHGELWHGGMDLGMERYERPTEWLRSYYNSHSAGKSVVCSKCIVGELQNVYNTIAIDSQLRKIVLIRKNPVQTSISAWLANSAGTWLDYSAAFPAPVTVDMDYLRRTVPLTEEANRCLDFIRIISNTLVIYYEDFGLDLFNRIFRFLGVHERNSVPAGEGAARLKVTIANKLEIEAEFPGWKIEDKTT